MYSLDPEERRRGAEKLSVLESREDMVADTLDRLILDGADAQEGDFTHRNRIINLKKAYSEYELASRRLSDRHQSMGSMAKSEEIRVSRQRRRLDVHELVHNLKLMMGSSNGDDVSSIDLNSVKETRTQEFVDAFTTVPLLEVPTDVTGAGPAVDDSRPPPPPPPSPSHASVIPKPSHFAVAGSRYSSSVAWTGTGGGRGGLIEPEVEPKSGTQYTEPQQASSVPPSMVGGRFEGLAEPSTEKQFKAEPVNPRRTSPALRKLRTGVDGDRKKPKTEKQGQAGLPDHQQVSSAPWSGRPGVGGSLGEPSFGHKIGIEPFHPDWTNIFETSQQEQQRRNQQQRYTRPPSDPYEFAPNFNYHGSQVSSLLANELNKLTISPFDGKPAGFWSWRGRIQQRISAARLTPLHQLLLLQENTTGPPRELIQDHLQSRGEIIYDDVTEIWSLLEERYGSVSRIADDLMNRLESFPVIRGKDVGVQLLKLYDFCKILNFNLRTNPTLQYMNTAGGLKVVRAKLPEKIQEEWRVYGQQYKLHHQGMHPPFGHFTDFLRRVANTWADADFGICSSERRSSDRIMLTNAVGESGGLAVEETAANLTQYCPIHERQGHHIRDCYSFRRLPMVDKKQKIAELKLCFKCLGDHFASRCQTTLQCSLCSERHITALHPDSRRQPLCTQLCSDPTHSKNCGKTVLVDLFLKDNPDKQLRAYAIIDDQSNTTLVDDCILDFFGQEFPQHNYQLNFASQNYKVDERGHIISGMQVVSAAGGQVISLPPVLTTKEITSTKHEVAGPEVVAAHSHISHLAKHFPPIDAAAKVMILIGRDCGPAMRCDNFSTHEPYCYRTPLGWALVGKTCLEDSLPERRVLHTSVQVMHEIPKMSSLSLERDPFQKLPDDEHPGFSVEDREFLKIMKDEVVITPEGSIQLPIPVKSSITLPDNRTTVRGRTANTLRRLHGMPLKLQSCLDSMKVDIDAGFVEPVPCSEIDNRPKWFLPIFPLANRKGKTRLVFDASAQCEGVSLNDAMLQGPDLNNSLRGVLLRFREQPVGFVTDVSQMFKAFVLPREQRDLYRFFWYQQNDPAQPLIQYRSRVHLFGSRASPAIATFGLKYAAGFPTPDTTREVVKFIDGGFYVDDGISSAANSDDAVRIIRGARAQLATFNIHLHKIRCSSSEVLKQFPPEDLADGHHALETKEGLASRTLGVAWDPDSDVFNIDITPPDKPFTKRGILAIINSLFDPLGIVSPVVLAGRLILRAVLPTKHSPTYIKSLDWDDPLPEEHLASWTGWLDTLNGMAELKIRRCFIPSDFKLAYQELHIYCDASQLAIGHVIYIRSISTSGEVHVGLVEANSRVAPRAATSIPRLELCGALDASTSAVRVLEELSRKPDYVHLYSDSQIVLAYLANTTRRFSRYVSRRVSIIRSQFHVNQWHYVSTEENPADLASRPAKPKDLLSSCWTVGPETLWKANHDPEELKAPSVAGDLPEVVHEQTVMRTETVEDGVDLFAALYIKISDLTRIVNVVVLVMKFLNLIDVARQRLGISLAPRCIRCSYSSCLISLITGAQLNCFPSEVVSLNQGSPLPGNSKIADLKPFIDEFGVVRVGGRLRHAATLTTQEQHPILLPAKHVLTQRIISHYHVQVNHQGRVLTTAALRQAGYFVQRGSQVIRKLLTSCVACRKLRGETVQQIMADLPADRLENVPPFTNVAMDVFGPFLTYDSRNGTRRTEVTKKTWVLIIVCMVSRGIHLELMPSMETAAFMNAYRRFQAVRGCTKFIRTDRGSNFMGVRNQDEKRTLENAMRELQDQDGPWKLHPANASHFAGSWERKIRSVRSVFQGSLLALHGRKLNRDDLSTLLQEAAAIVNNTPLSALTSRPEDPTPITPAHLLTSKIYPNPPFLEQFSKSDLYNYSIRRWKKVQYVAEEFWKRWKDEVVQQLQERQKWLKKRENLKIDDVVLVKNKHAPRNKWDLAQVQGIKTSGDGAVRSVVLRLPPSAQGKDHRHTTRCVQDVVFLFSEESGDVV